MAETGGFEPPVEFNPDPSLAVKSIRPLWHVSSDAPQCISTRISFVLAQVNSPGTLCGCIRKRPTVRGSKNTGCHAA
mgnify:CR=1 FL=1